MGRGTSANLELLCLSKVLKLKFLLLALKGQGLISFRRFIKVIEKKKSTRLMIFLYRREEKLLNFSMFTSRASFPC